MQGVTVRRATVTDIDGLVASITGLFAEDSVRDRLHNPGWPQAHAADDETENVGNPDMLVLLAERDGSVIGHLTGGFSAASAMWTAPRVHLISMHVMAECRGQHVSARARRAFQVVGQGEGRGPIARDGLHRERRGDPLLSASGLRSS